MLRRAMAPARSRVDTAITAAARRHSSTEALTAQVEALALRLAILEGQLDSRAQMKYRSLGTTGLQVSTLSLGCAPLGNVYGDISAQESERLVKTSIERGVNFLDTSPYCTYPTGAARGMVCCSRRGLGAGQGILRRQGCVSSAPSQDPTSGVQPGTQGAMVAPCPVLDPRGRVQCVVQHAIASPHPRHPTCVTPPASPHPLIRPLLHSSVGSHPSSHVLSTPPLPPPPPSQPDGDTESERVLGQCLKGVNRDDYILATKVGRYGTGSDFSGARVSASIDESLDRLGVDCIDLIQCHDIEFAGSLEQVIYEALPAMQEAKAAGKVKHIGITGLPLNVVDYVLEHSSSVNPDIDIETVLSYCCYTLNNTQLDQYIPRWRHRGIGIVQVRDSVYDVQFTNVGRPSSNLA